MQEEQVTKVLLVENDCGAAYLLQVALAEARRRQCRVTQVERLSDASQQLAREVFDAILLDLSLPDSQGLATYKTVQGLSPDQPIIVLTGRDEEALAIQAVQAGAHDYLLKEEYDSALLVRALHYAIELHRLRTSLHSLSLTDALTGLYNERGFSLLAEQQAKVSSRTKREFVLLFAELDDLKKIDKDFGRQEGDQALITTAEILRTTFRDSDIIARLDEGKFRILLIDTSEVAAELMITRLEKRLKDHNKQGTLRYKLSLSLAVEPFVPGYTGSLQALMARADTALSEQRRYKAPW